MLDDGRLTDNKGRVANFKNTIIIMTSNIGGQLIQEKYFEATKASEDAWLKFYKDEAKEQVMDLLKASVRPEFLNRIDEIVLFDPLGRKDIRKIVQIQFKQIQERLQEQGGITLEASNEVLDKLGEEGFDPVYGARPLKRVIQRRVMNELSKMILANKIDKDAVIMMNLDAEGEIAFENVETHLEIE